MAIELVKGADDMIMNDFLRESDTLRLFDDIFKNLDLTREAPSIILQIIAMAYYFGRLDGRRSENDSA